MNRDVETNDIFSTAIVDRHWSEAQHVIFDCDSTLSAIEGIDMLAKDPAQQVEIEQLTDAAMNGECALEDVYERRLDLLKPSKADILSLAQSYMDQIVDGAKDVVSTLLNFGIEVYVVSGGLLEPVQLFARALGIDASHVRAVPIVYDELCQNWWSKESTSDDQVYYRTAASQLTQSRGKIDIIEELLEGKQGRSMLIGDGTSDLNAAQAVDSFVGFGGVVSRPAVQNQAPIFIHCASLLPILPLALGNARYRQLNEIDRDLHARSLSYLDDASVSFLYPYLKDKFRSCFGSCLMESQRSPY